MKVGLITLLAIALAVVFAVHFKGFRAGATAYMLKVSFDDARGLERGDPVRMVGVKIGEVRSVEIEGRKAVAGLAIESKYPLYTHYQFRVATSGLIQERFVEVVPGHYTPEAIQLHEGDLVEGVMTPGISDLMVSGQQVLANLNRTSQLLQSVLSDQEVLAGVRDALGSFSASAEAAARLAESIAALAGESRPEIAATLQGVRSAAADVRHTASEVRGYFDQGSMLGDMEAAARHAKDTAEKMSELATNLGGLASPEVRQQLHETVSRVHEAAESIRVFSEGLREAAPAIPDVAREAKQMAETSAMLRERLKPPEIDARFDVLYSGTAGRSYSSGYLDFTTRKDHFLRLGIDDIGEDSAADFQLGETWRRGTLRYGLVRSRLGLGLDFPLPRQGNVSVDLFDPNDLRVDILGDVPLVSGRGDLGISAGIRDLGAESLFVAGVRMRR
jgi:phospholipid/cholesterol/gamma-HCH transport system substrate-binding protein